MPQRFLRPGITNSPRWNAVDPQAANLFIRILTLVDDFGRTDGRVSVLLGHCFSVWNECHSKKAVKLQQVADMLQQLIAVGLIDIYEIEDKRVLQVIQWQERIREGCKSKWPEKTEVAASCSKLLPSSSSPTSSPTSSPVHLRHSSNGLQKPSEPDDNVWRECLLQDPAYSHINIPAEFSKMQRWCEVNKKQPTRRRFINWLNRIEPAMQERKISRSVRAQPARSEHSPALTDEQIAKNKAVIGPLMADLAAKLTGQIGNPS